MVRSIRELRETSDECLIEEYDKEAARTVVGTDYYVEELDRRSRERATKAAQDLAVASNRLARRSFWLAVVSTVLSAVAAVSAVLALVLRP